jgi:hypothetical protein
MEQQSKAMQNEDTSKIDEIRASLGL